MSEDIKIPDNEPDEEPEIIPDETPDKSSIEYDQLVAFIKSILNKIRIPATTDDVEFFLGLIALILLSMYADYIGLI
jgi:hypothetical protein